MLSPKHDYDIIKQYIFEFFSNSDSKVSPLNLAKEISFKYDLEISNVKEAIQSLVAENELEYTYIFGSSYLEISFNKPINISKHIYLLPSYYLDFFEPDCIPVRLHKGISFGSGHHPTTRLSIKAIDFLIVDAAYFVSHKFTSALDIGTGNGVLAITAVQLGIHRALGIDFDASSVKEAMDNVSLNGLNNSIDISDLSLDCIYDRFSLIIANLRLPTLVEISSKVASILSENGAIVFSGIRNSEVDTLLDVYSYFNYSEKWRSSEKNWSCVILSQNI